MFINYGPYDLWQAELIRKDWQREMAVYTSAVFEGVSVMVIKNHLFGVILAGMHNAFTALMHHASPTTQPS